MDQTPNKGGHPRVFLTKDVVERRRMSKKRRNDSRRKFHDIASGGSGLDAGMTGPKRARVKVVPREVYATNVASHVIEAQEIGSDDDGSTVRECLPSQAYTAVGSQERKFGRGPNARVGESSGESRRMRTSIDQKKKQFMETNAILDVGRQEETCGFCAVQTQQGSLKGWETSTMAGTASSVLTSL